MVSWQDVLLCCLPQTLPPVQGRPRDAAVYANPELSYGDVMNHNHRSELICAPWPHAPHADFSAGTGLCEPPPPPRQPNKYGIQRADGLAKFQDYRDANDDAKLALTHDDVLQM